MSARSYLRGHPIIWKEPCWIYEDTGELAPTGEGEIRPCKRCGKEAGPEGVDPCLGELPGVTNACCGHGVREESYIIFTNGIVVRDFIVGPGEKHSRRHDV